jgi:beta-RFAP synthase
MIQVRTASRLHFGLLHVPSEAEDTTSRQFGGVGLMVNAPGIRLSVESATSWSTEGPLSERALAFARRFAQSGAPAILDPHRLVIEASAPEHAGLGTGTQLGLAVARALALSAGLSQLSVVELAQRVGRGLRSALGIHGFEHGGLLVEAGKHTPDQVAPLVARLAFPEEWRVVLVLPSGVTGRHGREEREIFQQRLNRPGQTDRLCRMVLLDLLPPLVEKDLRAFGEALHDFNALAGEAFREVQGGTYAGARVARIVACIRRLGIRGVGQSSWGPTVFAVTADEEEANDLVSRLLRELGPTEQQVLITCGCNQGATCVSSSEPIEAKPPRK